MTTRPSVRTGAWFFRPRSRGCALGSTSAAWPPGEGASGRHATAAHGVVAQALLDHRARALVVHVADVDRARVDVQRDADLPGSRPHAVQRDVVVDVGHFPRHEDLGRAALRALAPSGAWGIELLLFDLAV